MKVNKPTAVKILTEGIPIRTYDYKFTFNCDMCHHTAFNSYLYKGETLYRCQGHKIKNLTNLVSKYHS